jgi:hypothetical protein
MSSISVIAERSETLARVRDIDFEVVELLLRSVRLNDLQSIDAAALQTAFDNFRGYNPETPRIGLMLSRDGVTVASNLDGTSVEALEKKYGLPPGAIVRSNLNNVWQLTGVLIDKKYDFAPWHSFLTVPFRQLIDGRGVSWDILVHKAGVPFQIVVLAGLVLLALWGLWWSLATQAVRHLRQKIRKAATRCKIKEQHLQDANVKAAALKDTVEAQRARIAEQERAREAGATALRDSEETRETQRRELAETEQAWQAAELEAGKHKADLERLRQERDALVTTENTAKLQKQEHSSTESCSSLLKGIWDMDWHREALKETSSIFRASGRPGVRRHLYQLLHEVSQLTEDAPNDPKWSRSKGIRKLPCGTMVESSERSFTGQGLAEK